MTSKTIVLTGEEIRADYSGGTNAWLRNDGTATVYASTAPAVTPGADGVVTVSYTHLTLPTILLV